MMPSLRNQMSVVHCPSGAGVGLTRGSSRVCLGEVSSQSPNHLTLSPGYAVVRSIQRSAPNCPDLTSSHSKLDSAPEIYLSKLNEKFNGCKMGRPQSRPYSQLEKPHARRILGLSACIEIISSACGLSGRTGYVNSSFSPSVSARV